MKKNHEKVIYLWAILNNKLGVETIEGKPAVYWYKSVAKDVANEHGLNPRIIQITLAYFPYNPLNY